MHIMLVLPVIASIGGTTQPLRPGSLWQSKMIVQQQATAQVDGWAAPGKSITIRASWGKSAQAQADASGRWLAAMPVPDAASHQGQQQITISDGTSTLRLDSVLIGEVWLCSGQSNMEMTMKAAPPWHEGVLNREAEIAAANNPSIRIFSVKREAAPAPRDTLTGQWLSCTPQHAGSFSGVAYYFAQKVQQQTGLPIGMVVASYGGASCQAFMSRETLEKDTVLNKRYLQPWIEKPDEKELVLRPALIYNAIIHPLRTLSFRGILWYQGESNAGERHMYTHLAMTHIQSWRQLFNKPDCPFYFVQMTPYNWKKPEYANNHYAYFREAQEKVLQLSNTGMVVTMDVGEPDNIHPRNKKAVGERLALLALRREYGVKSATATGPVFTSLKLKNNSVILRFDKATLGVGLSTNDDKPARHFFVAGADRKFYPATATLNGRQLWLTCPQVATPVAVRYAFTNAPVTNLQNNIGLPARPFRTDAWDDATMVYQGEFENEKN